MCHIHIHIAPFLSNFHTQQLLKLTFKHIVNFRSSVGLRKVCSERREIKGTEGERTMEGVEERRRRKRKEKEEREGKRKGKMGGR